jgi:DNA-binding transcriptional LysR family regulator
MKNLHGISAFLESVNSGTFTVAAERLGVSTAAVSKNVAVLERHLGVRLFNRSTRRLSLTDEGQVFLDMAGSAVHLLEEAVAKMSQAQASPSGTVRISVGMSFGRRWVIPLLPGLAEKYPQLKLEVDLDNRPIDLLASGVDIALRSGVVEPSNLVARRFCEQPLVLLASAGYLAQAGMPTTPEALVGHRCICMRWTDKPVSPWYFRDGQGSVLAITPRAQMVASDPDALLDLVLADVGIAQLALNVAWPYLRSGALRLVMADLHHPGEGEMVLYYPHRQHMARRVKVVVDELLTHFAQATDLHLTREDVLARL